MALYFCTGVLKDETLFRHYALNVPFYTHFTSPIRRYADVLVHRLLSASLGGCHGALGAAGGGGGCPRTARAPGSLPRPPTGAGCLGFVSNRAAPWHRGVLGKRGRKKWVFGSRLLWGISGGGIWA